MAHHHSPSPSGSSRRRLLEMLGEQQEPFYLDLYLLEKGCSPAFLDAAACGGNCSTCWPTRARSTGARLLRRTPARRKMGMGRGVLRLLLSKILSGAGATTTRPAAAAAKKKRQQQQQPAAAIDWRCADADEKQGAPWCTASAAAPDSASAAAECRHRTEVEVDEEHEQREEEDDEEESKKQLSPVSVLEQRLFEVEHSPPPRPPHEQKAFVLFNDLLEAAYAPTTLVHLLANARQLQYSVNTSTDGHRRRRSSDGGVSTPAKTRRRRRTRNSKNNNSYAQARRREAEDDDAAFERDLAVATALVASEMPGGRRVQAEDLRPEREEVAAGVAAAVLEALTEEAAAELMIMGMDCGCTCG
ncbi:unnamed protein product [Urochloa humidicola]